MERDVALFRPAQAASLAGVSLASLKHYTLQYAPFFSPEATPPEGERRWFTLQDIKLLAFIHQLTNRGASKDEILRRLAGGELAEFQWQPPVSALESRPRAQAEQMQESLQAAVKALLEQLQQIYLREQELMERLLAAEHRIGYLEGELAALRAREERSSRGVAGILHRWLSR
ncbi:MAG: hypothetical protein Kow0047_04870 [Anaerolineae bacterium]